LTSGSVSASWIVPVAQNPEGSIALIAPPTLGQSGLVGAFTDNNGAVIEPIAIGASSRNFVVPVGATQLQLGVNDNHYADNGGSGFVVSINGVNLTNPVPATAVPWNWVTGGLNNNYPTPPPVGSLAFASNIICSNNCTGQTYIVVAKDSSGLPVFDTNVGFYVQGANNISQGGTTDTNGEVPFGFDHNSGAYTIMVVDSVNRNVVTNTLSGVWTPPTTSNPSGNEISVGVSAPTSVSMPNALQLNGTATDSLGNSLTATWTMLTGPGTVTFTPVQQPVTNGTFTATASFTEVGTYLLQVIVSNGLGGSAPLQINVTVVPALQDPQGWIGSPAYGSTVTGLVPITLAPNVALQSGSGTLIYYSASSPTIGTPLLITQTSGTIATLDTTTLVNGSYWIQLQANDTAGNSQYSLVRITVAGNYKPGRLTTVATDLVVPAVGLPINIQRQYDSLNAGTSGDFGYGWNLGINVNLAVDNAGNVTFTLGGQRKTFNFTPNMLPCTRPSGCLDLFPYYFVFYTPEPGFHGTLIDFAQACPLGIVIPDGSMWDCRDGSQHNPSSYIYTDPNGTNHLSGHGNQR